MRIFGRFGESDESKSLRKSLGFSKNEWEIATLCADVLANGPKEAPDIPSALGYHRVLELLARLCVEEGLPPERTVKIREFIDGSSMQAIVAAAAYEKAKAERDRGPE